MEYPTNFSNLDWIIVAVYLSATIVIGLYVKRYIRTMSHFIVAGRALKSRLAIATMIGTELGLVTVIYSAQKGYTMGFAAFHIGLVAAVMTLMVGLTGFLMVPLRRMGVMTIPEYYERRFGRRVRILGGTVLAFAGILNMGLFIKAGAVFISGITGLTATVELNLIMTAMLALVLFYTIFGGMISVVITDYIQFVVLSFGLIVVAVVAIGRLGWSNITAVVSDLRGPEGFNPFSVEGFGTEYVIWMVLMGLWGCSVWQTSAMRAFAAENTKVVKRLYVWASLGFLIRMVVPMFLGVCAFVYFAQIHFLGLCPVTCCGGTPDSLLAMPVFLGQILPAGLIGIITAGMLAAFMSTHDSYLLSWSSVLTQDVVAPLFRNGLSTRARLLLTRFFIFLIGLFILIWGLWYPLGQDLWDYMATSGTIYNAGGFAVLTFGIYWKRASSTGAVLAIAAGFLALLGLKPVQDLLRVELNTAHVNLGATALALVLMVAGSILFPDRETENRETRP